MTMVVSVAGRDHRLQPSKLVGQGGEAEVFSLGRHRVVKIFKSTDHPDFAGDPSLIAAAKARIEEHQTKLDDFPTGLPAAVVAPLELARDASGRIVGYTMKRIAKAEPLYALASSRSRRDRGLRLHTEVLLALYDAVAGLHARGVVIGDFNDLNVLVAGATPHLIDADSYQFGRYACPVYSERFFDPRLLSRSGAALDYSAESDWFAFAAIACQTLLSVPPYGGIHLPPGSRGRVPQSQRATQRLSIFNANVRLPRPALPPAVLPEPLRAYFRDVFAANERAPMAREQLAELDWSKCTRCGLEHARRACPHCAPGAVSVAQRVPARAAAITDPTRIAALRGCLRPSGDFWIDGSRLLRRGSLGPVHVGNVLAGATRFWVGDSLGLGFYSAGRLRVGFLFDRFRRGVNDQVELEPVRGTLAAANCALSDTRAWLSISEARGPTLATHLTAVASDGRRLARADVSSCEWASGLPGACAVGDVLLVPTDSGVIRLECRGGAFVVAKTFAGTADVLDCSSQLLCDGRALYAEAGGHFFELSCQ